MSLYENEMYIEDLKYVADLNLPWEKLQGKGVMLSGATGMFGSFFIDVLLYKNEHDDLNCSVFALGRNKDKAIKRFCRYVHSPFFTFIPYDVNNKLEFNEKNKIDYIMHLASNTHPIQYSTDPIGTITTNIIGVQHLMDFAVNHKTRRFLFASSNEIYGENRGDVEFFDEDYCGYINSNTLRAGYPESKRCAEALCQAYIAQKDLDVVIARFTRSYGPTMLMTDTKAISQFVKNGVAGEDIVLKSAGTQNYSYQYVADSVAGLFYILLCGERGEAYNIAEEHSDMMLKDLAETIARISGKNVIFELPSAIEAAGYSKATKARLNGHKLQRLGWKPKYNIETGMSRTIAILRSI